MDCKRICLSKENMEEEFLKYLEELFSLPEIVNAKVRDIVIHRDSVKDDARRAFEAGYHDCYSDIDLSVKAYLPKNGLVTAEDYVKHVERFGVTEDTALGWCYIPENRMYRMIFKNGMRYDFGFDFEYDGDAELSLEEHRTYMAENANWPIDNVNRFWFVQIQALAKLYRRDYLISSHLANVNCNETLVMQMVMRDLERGTTHHRYGYAEELEYVKDLEKMPYQMDDEISRRIANQLYAAALTYDRLVKNFYPEYVDRSSNFFAIWDCYQLSSNKEREI